MIAWFTYMYVCHRHACCLGMSEVYRFPGNGEPVECEQPCGSWEPNSAKIGTLNH